MNWREMIVWIVGWIMVGLMITGCVCYGIYQFQNKQVVAFEKGYQFIDYKACDRSWRKVESTNINQEYVQALNALIKRVNLLEVRDGGTKKGRR